MKRLGFHTLRDKATDTLGDKLSRQLQEDVAPKMSDEEAFSFAEFNAEDAERGGYSDYSYWKSTLRAFFQNKIAVFFLIVMVAVLLFTFIQPYLRSEGSHSHSQRPVGSASEQYSPQQRILVRNKLYRPGSLGAYLGGHPHFPVHWLLCRSGGGRGGHPRGRAVGLCPQAGLLFYRAV